MKAILIPTDFSDAANVAVDYAAQLAQDVKASVILYNCFHVPVIASDGPVVTIPFEDLEKDSEDTLAENKKKLLTKYPGLTIKTESRVGFAAEEIVHSAKRQLVDLIVMGI